MQVVTEGLGECQAQAVGRCPVTSEASLGPEVVSKRSPMPALTMVGQGAAAATVQPGPQDRAYKMVCTQGPVTLALAWLSGGGTLFTTLSTDSRSARVAAHVHLVRPDAHDPRGEHREGRDPSRPQCHRTSSGLLGGRSSSARAGSTLSSLGVR